MQDQQLARLNELIVLILEENAGQLNKWGIQDRSPFEWLTYAMEEVGEVAEAIQEHEYHDGCAGDVIAECIQAVTLLLKIAEMYVELKEKPVH